jgi:hypothetical protein
LDSRRSIGGSLQASNVLDEDRRRNDFGGPLARTTHHFAKQNITPAAAGLVFPDGPVEILSCKVKKVPGFD